MNTTTAQVQKVNFFSGVYDPSEVRDIVSHLPRGQINFHKLQYLAHWETNHSKSPDLRDKKIGALIEQRNELKSLIELAKIAGYDLRIEGNIEVKLVDKDIDGSR